MTRKEHLLMVAVLSRQAMVIRALSDALVNNGYLKADDVPAYGAALDEEKKEVSEIMKKTLELYTGCAEALQLDTGL